MGPKDGEFSESKAESCSSQWWSFQVTGCNPRESTGAISGALVEKGRSPRDIT